MSTAHDLSRLLERVAQGDRQAFNKLYARTSAKLFGVTLRILRRREIAEEALQDVYVRIWEKASDFRPGDSSPITWMVIIARNRSLDIMRRTTEQPLPDDYFEIRCDGNLPLELVEQREEVNRLLGCLEELEAQKREMILLAYRDGATREELAKRYECPLSTVKTRLRRGLATLKECLGK
ncbi:MAG: sigma-70 family RNA polymerase sigma factor [Alphaproteobacteria bacterium]|nr:sigma-70 family RNA polymerase sigma factor [Alphaproteobacteria bacterium]